MSEWLVHMNFSHLLSKERDGEKHKIEDDTVDVEDHFLSFVSVTVD